MILQVGLNGLKQTVVWALWDRWVQKASWCSESVSQRVPKCSFLHHANSRSRISTFARQPTIAMLLRTYGGLHCRLRVTS